MRVFSFILHPLQSDAIPPNPSCFGGSAGGIALRAIVDTPKMFSQVADMALSDAKIKQAKPQGKSYKLTDEKGLFLFVSPKGSKLWRMKYRYGGKENIYSIGAYPGTII